MKTIITLAISGAALLLLSTIQLAGAAERFHNSKARHVHHVFSQPFDSNASVAGSGASISPMPGYLINGGLSAPAGH